MWTGSTGASAGARRHPCGRDWRGPSSRSEPARSPIPERILITGAQGFLGRHLVAEWLSSRPAATVLGVGRSEQLDGTFTHQLRWATGSVTAPLPAELRDTFSGDRYRYERVDVCDPGEMEAVLRTFEPDVIVHAASALRDEAWRDLFRSNVQSVIGIVEAIGASGRPPPRLVVVSSGSVYGAKDPDALPLEEGDPCVPLDLYAASKLAAEDVARILSLEHDVPLVRARVFNLLGPGLQDRHFAASVAGQIAAMTRGLARAPLQVGRLDTTRDLVDVRDVSRALVILAERAPAGPGSLFNVASGREIPIREVLDHLLHLGGIAPDRVERDVATRAVDVWRSYADIGRSRALGFRPAIDLVRSLSDMLRYYQESVATAV